MSLFGYPIEIWVAIAVSILIKLQSNKRLTLLGAITTVSVALASGLLLYQPIVVLFSLSPSWEIIVAILVALTAENLMKTLVEISADRELLTGIVKFLVNKKLEGDKEEKIIVIREEDKKEE